MCDVWFGVLNTDGQHARIASSEHKRSNQETCPRAENHMLFLAEQFLFVSGQQAGTGQGRGEDLAVRPLLCAAAWRQRT